MSVKGPVSYLHSFTFLKFFSGCSGLCVNNNKTELFAIGAQKLLEEELLYTVRTSIQRLGIVFDHGKLASFC